MEACLLYAFRAARHHISVAGKDRLRLRWDMSVSSYWIQRHPPGPAPESMIHQF